MSSRFPLRHSAYLGGLCVNSSFDAEDAEIRRGPQRLAIFGLVVLVLLTGCRVQNGPVPTEAPSETIVSSTPPFKTKEPERYQATRTITIVSADGKTIVEKNSTARDGDKRRHESETFSKKVVHLDLPEGRFILFPDDKVYAELSTGFDPTIDEAVGITSEWLLHEDAGTTSYQNLGKEVVGGRNAIKYKTVVNSSSGGNVTQSETLIWIDEVLNMPIRSEMTSTAGGLRITMELSNVKLDVDEGMFQVPNDYEKIAIREFRRRLMATE